MDRGEIKILEELNLTSNSVQETMLASFWCRATYSKKYPELLNDPLAIQILDKIETKIDDYLQKFVAPKFMEEWRALLVLIRARAFDDAIKRAINEFPYLTIVNIGAGLNTGFSRVDNGKIKWFDLDLPDAIAFRKKLIPETPRSKYIEKSVFDYDWFEEVGYDTDQGIFFTAGGVFMYFEEEKVRSLFIRMADRYSGGEMILDSISKFALRIANKRLKKQGKENDFFHFGIANPVKQFAKWSDKIIVKDWYTSYSRTPRNPKWNDKTYKMMKIADRLKTAKIINIQFK
ncbi:MAG: class I SAM-dependent methyltransferase [Promethearchaeota archaeon]